MTTHTAAKRSVIGHSGRARRFAASTILGAGIAGLVLVGAGAGAANASTTAPTPGRYHFQTINDAADPTFNQLLGINDWGVIAGYFGSGTPATVHPNKGYTVGRDHDQDDYRNENFPGSLQTQVVGINNRGTTVGFWADAAGDNFGFVLEHGHYRSVSNPASSGAPRMDQLLGVNDHDVAVGFYTDAAGNAHGYTYNIHSGVFSAITVAGASSVTATGINDAGHVSGFAVINGVTEAFLLEHHHVTLTEMPGSSNTQALGVNNFDVVVGSYMDAAGNTHGFVQRAHHAPTTVDDPNAAGMTVINGLNDRGQLVGFYLDAAGNTDGLLATVR